MHRDDILMLEIAFGIVPSWRHELGPEIDTQPAQHTADR